MDITSSASKAASSCCCFSSTSRFCSCSSCSRSSSDSGFVAIAAASSAVTGVAAACDWPAPDAFLARCASASLAAASAMILSRSATLCSRWANSPSFSRSRCVTSIKLRSFASTLSFTARTFLSNSALISRTRASTRVRAAFSLRSLSARRASLRASSAAFCARRASFESPFAVDGCCVAAAFASCTAAANAVSVKAVGCPAIDGDGESCGDVIGESGAIRGTATAGVGCSELLSAAGRSARVSDLRGADAGTAETAGTAFDTGCC